MARMSGIYSLCVKYDNDPQIYMVELKAKTEDKNKTKYNIELIDAFTSRYPSKEALYDVVEKSVASHRRPVPWTPAQTPAPHGPHCPPWSLPAAYRAAQRLRRPC